MAEVRYDDGFEELARLARRAKNRERRKTREAQPRVLSKRKFAREQKAAEVRATYGPTMKPARVVIRRLEDEARMREAQRP